MTIEAVALPQNYMITFAFRPVAGGIGYDVAPTSTGVAYALPDSVRIGGQIQAYNDAALSSTTYYITFATSSALSGGSVAGLPVPPGALLVYSIPNDQAYTHMIVKTRSGSPTGTINFGLGT